MYDSNAAASTQFQISWPSVTKLSSEYESVILRYLEESSPAPRPSLICRTTKAMFSLSLNTKRCCTMLAALGFLSASPPAVARAAASADRLQSLVRDTSTQIQLAYRLHPTEQRKREEQLTAVVAAWRAAPRTEANNDRLNAWLRSAIRASMPGSREALPPMPTFASSDDRVPRAAERTPAETRAIELTPVAATPNKADEKSATDPFRDDPIDDQE